VVVDGTPSDSASFGYFGWVSASVPVATEAGPSSGYQFLASDLGIGSGSTHWLVWLPLLGVVDSGLGHSRRSNSAHWYLKVTVKKLAITNLAVSTASPAPDAVNARCARV
jgi:hypothetical protein